VNGWLYDAIAGVAERKFLSKIRAGLISQIRGEVVEIGAGTGASFPYYHASTRVLAIEPNASMAARAHRRATEHGPHITLLQGGDEALDTLPEESVDHVVAMLVMCSVENPASTLRRIRRVLRPEGTLAFIEHCRADGFAAKIQDHLTPLWSRIFGNCHLNREFLTTLLEGGFHDAKLSNKNIPLPAGRIVYGAAKKT
jgi:ubiquinone/menaquinone biosynthesis C-methylase UbiE